MKSNFSGCRRDFLKTTLAGGLATVIASRFVRPAMAAAPAAPAAPASGPTKVALTNGDQRTDNVFRALKALEKEITQAIGNRRVIIKPNFVSTTNQLAASNKDAVAGILDFLKSIGKLDNAVIAESALGTTMQGFQNFGYTPFVDKYKVKLVDLDTEKFEIITAFSETDAIPHPVRVSSMILNQAENFVISACMLKTHDRAVCTMGIKNIIVGAALKAAGGGGRGARGGGGGGMGDKGTMHGGGFRGININLAMIAPLLHPSLTVIDGFDGMQGNGPIGGTRVDHRVCVASTDYLAADIVGARLMGIDPANVGYLTYLTSANAGEWDVKKMEILGEPIEKLAKKYQLSSSSQQQLQWKTPARVTG
jgi:uncharacterized protein (DUF362 family)